VFNFDVPWQPDDYIHRIGRTGRAGATGIAITLAASADADQLSAIEKLIGRPIPPMDGVAEPAPDVEGEEKKPRGRKKAEPREREARPETAEPKSRRKPSEDRKSKPAPEPAQEREEALELADEGGWNGPVPSFLGQGFGS
jgi:superfamily II DNA/RNA helicase